MQVKDFFVEVDETSLKALGGASDLDENFPLRRLQSSLPRLVLPQVWSANFHPILAILAGEPPVR